MNFLVVAEKMHHKLLQTLKLENKPSISKLMTARTQDSSLELIQEEGLRSPDSNSHQKKLDLSQIDEEGDKKGAGEPKKSIMTKTLLSNYLLGISLMKNIAMRFSGNQTYYQAESMAQIARILEIESRYGLNSQSPELGIGFLVN